MDESEALQLWAEAMWSDEFAESMRAWLSNNHGKTCRDFLEAWAKAFTGT